MFNNFVLECFLGFSTSFLYYFQASLWCLSASSRGLRLRGSVGSVSKARSKVSIVHNCYL